MTPGPLTNAAPELLEACLRIVICNPYDPFDVIEARIFARRAAAKAFNIKPSEVADVARQELE